MDNKTTPAVCPCKKKGCERHGDCERCLGHHALHKKYPPYCQRPGRNRIRSKRTEKNENRETGLNTVGRHTKRDEARRQS